MSDGTDKGHEEKVDGGELDPRIHGYAEECFTTARRRAEVASLPPAVRQSLVARMLVRSPTFEGTVSAVRGFHMPVTGGHPQRDVIAGILGGTRVGKTWALKHYARSLGDAKVENAVLPRALYVGCYEGCTSLVLAAKLRTELRLKPRKGSTVLILEGVVRQMEMFGIELVIIDDAQFALGSKSAKTRDEIAGFVREIHDRKAGCVVLVGDEALDEAVRANPLLMGRGSWPTHRVGPYVWSTNQHDPGEFRDALDDVSDKLPFAKASDLGELTTAAHLYKLSGGRFGVAMTYVREAAYAAIDGGADRVTVDHLRAAAAKRRRVGDAYEAFVSRVDKGDPAGVARAARTAAAEEANADPTLNRKRVKHPFTERERA